MDWKIAKVISVLEKKEGKSIIIDIRLSESSTN